MSKREHKPGGEEEGEAEQGAQCRAWTQGPEIMTWAEDTRLTDWATQASQMSAF